jgi:hypothetical protein
VASYFFRSGEFWISNENCRISMAAVRERKRKMVEGLVQMHIANYKASGAELFLGSGRFVAPKSIDVTFPDGSVRHLRGKPSCHSVRQQFRHSLRYLGRKDFAGLAIKMDVIAMQFGMPAHCGVEIDGRDPLSSHYFRRKHVARGDPIV